MATYKEMMEEIARLQQEAEVARQAELQGAIRRVLELMAEYDIHLSDLQVKPKKGAPRDAKFKDPVTGQSWSGRGRKPHWLSGKDQEVFRV